MSKLPILMYHNVCKSNIDQDNLTISEKNLKSQFQYLHDHNYKTFHFAEVEHLTSIPPKSIILTFDDITENQFTYVIPLLEKFNFKASFFIPFHYIGKTDFWNSNADGKRQNIMTFDQLKKIPSELIELGYHSYEHKKYSLLSMSEIQNDFLKCEEVIRENNLKVYSALAYPYGNYPKEKKSNINFKNIVSENNMKFGLRIGNRPNIFPFKDRYEIKRIDIKGKDSLLTFRLKIRFGKLRLF